MENKITEDYVSFEVAKLLKEKGFDWEVHRSYLVNDSVFIPGDISDVPLRKDVIRIPTLQMAMKWLREVHKLYVVVRPYVTEEGTLSLFDLKSIKEKGIVVNLRTKTGFNTYEEACEAAIKYCLENLI